VLERLAYAAAAIGRAEDAIHAQLHLVGLSAKSDRAARVCALYDICAKFERVDVARPELERAHRDYPNDANIRSRLTQLYEKAGAHVELAQLLISTAESETNAEVVAESLVRAAQLLGAEQPVRALECLEKAERLFPSVPAELGLARHHASHNNRREATELYTRVANNTEPRYSDERAIANLELAQLHLGVDQLAEAHEALGVAFRFRTKNAGIAWQLAQLALDLSDDDGAKRALRVLVGLKIGPKDGDECVTPETKSKAYYYLGRMLNWQGDTTGARRMLSRALEEDPGNALAQTLQKGLS